MKRSPRNKLWRVYILPNNQPTIDLGDYYAISAKRAMELASVDLQIPIDENWGASEVAGRN